MPLEDRDIFLVICERFSDQPMEFIMEQYEKAKRMNIQIEKRIGTSLMAETPPAEEECATVVEEIEEVPPEPQKKKYTRRSLKVKPQDAITESFIKCCICGEERQSLTAKHLAAHGISVEDYKKLCGYAPNQPLMSLKRLAKSKEIIARAQKARMEKRAQNAEY